MSSHGMCVQDTRQLLIDGKIFGTLQSCHFILPPKVNSDGFLKFLDYIYFRCFIFTILMGEKVVNAYTSPESVPLHQSN